MLFEPEPVPEFTPFKLNDAQQRAAVHGDGPLLVIAGAGTGKTRVITERIRKLFERDDSLVGENVLALTYTIKAAGEMLRRHSGRVPGWVATGLPVAIGALQVIAWYLAARRSAVGVAGPLDFLGHAQWSPPGGWAPWLVCAIAGGVLIATSPTVPSYSRRRSPRVAASASPPRT